MNRRLLRAFRTLVEVCSGFDPAHWEWFRKTWGGRWELWWVDVPVCSEIWHEDCREGERPTSICRGIPIAVHDCTEEVERG